MNDTPTPVPLSEADRGGRPRRRLERHARALVTAVMLLLAFSAGVGVDRMVLINAPVWGAQRIADLEDLDQFTVLAETYQIIREHYVLSDEVSDEELIYGAAAGMVDALGDEGHSRFLDPEQARRYEESRRGEYVGIGITVDTTIHPPRVIMPYQGSPALEAGIRQSDVILAIDGTPYSEFESADLFVELIGGDEGTEVTLELRRDGEVEPYTVTVTRSRIEINPVSWAMMPNDILWIRLQSFNTGASEGIAAALKDGQARGARGVILDLRANPGGLELEAIAVGTQFQPDGTVLYQVQDVTGDVDQVESVGDEGLWQSGPLVVLIDGDSASASEVFSSGVQDNGRGVLVGQTTFGTGTVIRGQPVSDGSMVMIGFELWLTADGNVIWHRGVPPDVEVTNEPGVQISLPFLFPSGEVTEADLSTSQDTQLLVAIEEVLAQMEDAGP
jgi:carboxyl-terminal processing protease